MLIARNAKIHGLYITLFVVISCSGVDLTIDANFQSAVASQLRAAGCSWQVCGRSGHLVRIRGKEPKELRGCKIRNRGEEVHI